MSRSSRPRLGGMDQRRVNGYLTRVAPWKGEAGDAGVAPTDACQNLLIVH
jgi:hypothetical protein